MLILKYKISNNKRNSWSISPNKSKKPNCWNKNINNLSKILNSQIITTKAQRSNMEKYLIQS